MILICVATLFIKHRNIKWALKLDFWAIGIIHYCAATEEHYSVSNIHYQEKMRTLLILNNLCELILGCVYQTVVPVEPLLLAAPLLLSLINYILSIFLKPVRRPISKCQCFSSVSQHLSCLFVGPRLGDIFHSHQKTNNLGIRSTQIFPLEH